MPDFPATPATQGQPASRASVDVDPRSLKPYPANYNTHPPEQIDELARSLAQFDQPKSIVIWQGHVIAGHGLVQAAIKAGRPTIEARDVSDWPQEKAEAFLIADNETARMGVVDYARLKALTEIVKAQGVAVPGVTAERLAEIVAEAKAGERQPGRDAEPQIDKAAQLKEKWGTALGQVWELGEHRLACGDCTDRAVVESVMRGERAALCVTSPPYNIGSSITEESHQANKRKYDNDKDEMSDDEYFNLLNGSLDNALSVCEYVFFNLQSLARNKVILIEWLYKNRNKYADVMIWDKTISEPAYPRQVLSTRFEYVFIFSQKATRAIGTKGFRGTIENLFSINSRQEKKDTDIHRATFPTEFASHLVGNFCNDGEVCLDPFSGLGTTLIACENLGRKCRAIELDPGYVAVAIQRWVDLTKQEPRLV